MVLRRSWGGGVSLRARYPCTILSSNVKLPHAIKFRAVLVYLAHKKQAPYSRTLPRAYGGPRGGGCFL